MNGIQQITLAAALALLSMASRAAPIENCVTPEGQPAYGDTVQNECKNAPIRRLRPDGSDKDVIPAPTAPDQRSEKEEKDRRRAQCNELNREQKRKDDALLDRYPSEDDLQEARYRELGDQLRLVDQANGRLKKILADGIGLIEQAKFFEPPHQMPPELKRDREVNDELAHRQFLAIAEAFAGIQRVNDKYDAELKRYRELVTGKAKMPYQCEE